MFQTASRVPVGAPALTAVRPRNDAQSYGVPADGIVMSTTKGVSAITVVIARGPAARGAPV